MGLAGLLGSGRIAKVAECRCGCDVFVRVLAAWRMAGPRRERVGDVCECVRCGARVTVLQDGSVVRFQGAALARERAGEAGAGDAGGAGDERVASLFADMVTLP